MTEVYHVGIGTTAPWKVRALETVLSDPSFRWFLTGDNEESEEAIEYQVNPIKVGRVASAFPQGDREGMMGARERAKRALFGPTGSSFPDFIYGVGIQGASSLVHRASTRSDKVYARFYCYWVAIMDRRGGEGIGTSARILLPERGVSAVDQGNFTRLTRNQYTTALALQGAIRAAFAPFLSGPYY